MSDRLCQAFQTSLNLKNDAPSELGLSELSPLDQAQAQQWLTLSSRFPDTFKELNDALRTNTFLLGGTEASNVDAFVLGRAAPALERFGPEQIINFRHIVRWAMLIQKVAKVEKPIIEIDLDTEAPRELPEKKEKKGDESGATNGKDKKKADKKANKQTDKKAEPAAAEETKSAAKPEAALTGANQQNKKKEKKEKKPQPAAAPARAITPGMIDFRVGFIQKAVKHPDADSLYVSTIDVGEAEPRTICSGLVKFVSLEDMQQRKIVVVANLKPVKMRGILSNGMVLCASTHDHTQVEFIRVPENAQPGDKIFFEGFDEEPEPVLNPKKKLWEQIQPNFSTADDFTVVYRHEGQEHKLVNKKGEIFAASTIKDANVS